MSRLCVHSIFSDSIWVFNRILLCPWLDRGLWSKPWKSPSLRSLVFMEYLWKYLWSRHLEEWASTLQCGRNQGAVGNVGAVGAVGGQFPQEDFLISIFTRVYHPNLTQIAWNGLSEHFQKPDVSGGDPQPPHPLPLVWKTTPRVEGYPSHFRCIALLHSDTRQLPWTYLRLLDPRSVGALV